MPKKTKPTSDDPVASERFVIVVETEWQLPAYTSVDLWGCPSESDLKFSHCSTHGPRTLSRSRLKCRYGSGCQMCRMDR
jgi:hypothetical protein